MPEEFQPFFYLSHKDLKSRRPGRIIGVLILFVAVLLIPFKLLFQLALPWSAIGLLVFFGIGSLYLGTLVREEKKDGGNEEDAPHEDKREDEPPIIEGGHSL